MPASQSEEVPEFSLVWAEPTEEMPILLVPDEPAPMPADVASKPKEIQEEVAQIIGNMANVSNPSHRSLGEVVASVNAVPRSTPSIPKDKHTNLGGSEPFKCFGRNANGEFIVLPGWEKARSLEQTDRLALTLFPLLFSLLLLLLHLLLPLPLPLPLLLLLLLLLCMTPSSIT